MSLLVILKGDQLLVNRLIIQKSKFVAANRYALTDTGVFVEIVVITKAIFINDVVNHFTAFATEYSALKTDLIRQAIFSAVITTYFCSGNRWHRLKELK